jgi:predicted acylesterase/phospholipase RssA
MAKAEQILFAVVALFCLFLFTAQSKNLREERQEHKLLFDSNSPKDKKVCRALVLEGGGDKGSW